MYKITTVENMLVEVGQLLESMRQTGDIRQALDAISTGQPYPRLEAVPRWDIELPDSVLGLVWRCHSRSISLGVLVLATRLDYPANPLNAPVADALVDMGFSRGVQFRHAQQARARGVARMLFSRPEIGRAHRKRLVYENHKTRKVK